MHFRNLTWGPRIIRAFGVLNILFAAAGVYLASGHAIEISVSLHDCAEEPYVREAYIIMTVVDLCCILALAVGGMYLLRLKRRGLVISCIVFVTEIAWFFGTAALWLAGMSGGRGELVGTSIAAASGIGGMGTAPQILTAYPIWALVVLILMRRSFPDRPIQNG